MTRIFFAVSIAAALAAGSAAAQSEQHKSKSSAEAKIGEGVPGDASSGTSATGRARAGIEVGTATQGGRTDTGAPVGAAPARSPSRGATMMPRAQQKKDRAAARKRGAARGDRNTVRKEVGVPTAAPPPPNRQQ